MPQMLNRRAGWADDEAIVVGEKVLAGIVMTVLQPCKEARDFGNLPGQRLGNFPQRLGGPGPHSVLVVEDFAARRAFERRRPIVHQILRIAAPRTAMRVSRYRPALVP